MPASRAASFWTAAGVIVLSQWGGAAASVVYPLYAAQWHLSTAVTTTVFAAYPVALAVVLALFGGISDTVGRRAALLAGLTLMACGALIFALAPDTGWLYAGRVAQGAGVGASVGAASAALVDFNTSPARTRASAVNTIASSVGLVAAVVVGGALVQYAPAPTHLSFWLLVALILVAVGLVRRMPPHDGFDAGRGRVDPGRGWWRPTPLSVPRESRRIFVAAAASGFMGLGLGSIILSLGAQIAKVLIHTTSALSQGLLLAISAAVIGAVGLVARGWSPRACAAIGGVTGAAAILLFIPAADQHSVALYVLSQLLGGAGTGFGLLGGVGFIHRHAPVHDRGRLMSAFYLSCYVAQGVIATSAGLAASRWGLSTAIDIFAPSLAVVGLASAAIALTTRSPRLPATRHPR